MKYLIKYNIAKRSAYSNEIEISELKIKFVDCDDIEDWWLEFKRDNYNPVQLIDITPLFCNPNKEGS